MSATHKAWKAIRVLTGRDRLWLRALRRGVAPSLEHLSVLRLMTPSLVVDIGANRGQFALATRHCHPDAMIHSFEPLPGPAATFRRVFAKDSRVHLHESAIGPVAGEATIHVSARDDSSSLLPIGTEQDRLFPGTAESRIETIRVGRLHDFIASGWLSPAMIADIGANRGQFALATRHCHPDAMIHSFEPLPGPAATFRRVFAKDSRVHLHESAIGPVAGEATIHVSARDDSSSLLPIGTEQDRLFPGTAESRIETIRVGRLHDFIAAEEIVPSALLKLDVQGFELSALQGCEDLLQHFAWVYVECSFIELYEGQALADEVIDYLSEHEFRLVGVYNMDYDKKGIAIQADFLFCHRT